MTPSRQQRPYGPLPTTPQELVEQIAAFIGSTVRFPTTCSGVNLRRKPHTNELFAALQKLGQAKGMDVWHTTPNRKRLERGEFLTDFVWTDASHRMTLAVESEFSSYQQAVLNDFEKLLYLKAAVKVLVCVNYNSHSTLFDEIA